METKKMSDQDNAELIHKLDTENSKSLQQRRKLLKGTAALPVVLTLHSGAALARSSNIVGETDLANALFTYDGGEYKLICVIYDKELDNGNFDLGDSPSYTLISTNQPIKNLSQGNRFEVAGDHITLCHNQLLPGIMISNAAFISIQGKTGVFSGITNWTTL